MKCLPNGQTTRVYNIILKYDTSVYLMEHLTLNKYVHQHQIGQANDLQVPMARTCSEQRTFCFNGVRDFNMLPSHAKNASSYGQFRSKLDIE